MVLMSAGYLAKCGRKRRHLTQTEAEDQRWSLIRSGKWKPGGSNTYWCNQCGFWHVGSVKGTPCGKSRKTAKNTPRFLASQ